MGFRYPCFLYFSMDPSSQKTSVNLPHPELVKLNAPPGSQQTPEVLWEPGETCTQEIKQKKSH